jgi:hypothetical protein
VSSTEVDFNSALIKFQKDSTVTGTDVAAAAANGDGSGVVGVNPAILNDARSANFWKWAGAHEVVAST